MLSQIETDGYAIQDDILSGSQVDELIETLEKQQEGESLLRLGRTFAVRNLLQLPEIGKLAESESVSELARAVLGDTAFPVRGILFDKIPEANWKVPWHQDVTIAVREKEEVEDEEVEDEDDTDEDDQAALLRAKASLSRLRRAMTTRISFCRSAGTWRSWKYRSSRPVMPRLASSSIRRFSSR